MGVSYNRSKFDDEATRSLNLWGAHVSLISQAFRLLYEYDQAEIENPAGYSKGELQGHLALVSLSWEGVSPVFSYQKLDYDDLLPRSGLLRSLGRRRRRDRPGRLPVDDRARLHARRVRHAETGV